MKLSCAFVSRILGSRVTSEPMPAWVARHLSVCSHCRAEAEQYSRLSNVIRQSAAGDESLSLSWHQLRATLPAREARPVSRVPAFAFAAVAVVFLLAACLGLSILRGRDIHKMVMTHSSHMQSVRTHLHNEVANKPSTKQFVVPEEKTPAAKRVDRGIHKLTPAFRQHFKLPPQTRLLRRNDPIKTQAKAAPERQTKPDSSHYTVVAAEEHVIDVVGVGSTADPTDSNTSYVIRTADTGDDHRVALL